MNVLQVAPYFPPYQGGQERHVLKLSEKLLDIDYRVKVLTSNFPEVGPSEEVTGAEVYRLPVWTRILRNPITPPQSEVLDLFQWADVVHVHNEHALLSNIAAVAGRAVETPLVLTCHGQLSFRSRVADLVERLYNRTVGAATLKQMDRVIALSESDREYLVSLGVAPDRTEIVPNAVSLPDPVSEDVVEGFETETGLRDSKVILFVGPVLRRKSPDTLIRAMPRIREVYPDAVALVVGKGAYLETVKTEVEKRGLQDAVRFTGYLSERHLGAAYETADLLAVPSVSEGLPTTVMEGMSYELPIVATDLPPLRDWFEEHVIFAESNPESFAEAVTDLLRNPSLAAEMGRAGAELVRSRFTWDHVAGEVDTVYRDLVQQDMEPTSPLVAWLR